MHSNPAIRLVVFMWGVAAVLCMMLIHSDDMSEQQIQRDHYCAMVEIYKQSGGQYGWPAYNGEC